MVQTKRSNSDTGINANANGSDANNNSQMEKGVKLWQVIASVFGVLVTVITLIVNQSNKIETQKLRIEFLESAYRDYGILLRDMANKNNADYNDIKNQLTDLKVMLSNKEDRNKK